MRETDRQTETIRDRENERGWEREERDLERRKLQEEKNERSCMK